MRMTWSLKNPYFLTSSRCQWMMSGEGKEFGNLRLLSGIRAKSER